MENNNEYKNRNLFVKVRRYANRAEKRHQNILTKKRKGQWLRRKLTKNNNKNINNTRKIALAGERAILSKNNLRRYSRKLRNYYNKEKSSNYLNYMGRYPGANINAIIKREKKTLQNLENEIGEVEEELRQRNAEEN
jgi:hypothetical protein